VALRYSLRNKAFSLLELIIAVAILSIGIIVVLQAFSFSAHATGLSGDIIRAVFLAEDKIQELEFQARQKNIKEESVEDVNGRFNWGYSINLDKELNLYKLDLRIDWQRQRRKQSLEVDTYLR
jgi:type II secretion system protein I